MKNLILTFLLVSILMPVAKVTAQTSYPETIVLKQINGAEKERLRLAQGHKKYDQQPTGFYLPAGKKAIVNVEITTQPTGISVPVITIGTLGMLDNERKEIPLKSGLNTIEATHHNGGLIYLSFTTTSGEAPTGEAKITFATGSQHIRAPRYVYGTTTEQEFATMMNQYSESPEVIFHSDYIIVVATRKNALNLSLKEDKKKWMEALHSILQWEDEISGLDNNDPNPLHHRLKKGEIRFLVCENVSTSPHANAVGYVGFPAGEVVRYLTYEGTYDRSWMIGHELGHQHQQPAYMVEKSVESTVNIYSYFVERSIQQQKGNTKYYRTSLENWQKARKTYLAQPVEKRIYNMPDEDLKELVGFNRDILRFMLWEQLYLIFGDNFYKTLHRITREEKVVGGSEQQRRYYLILKASQVAGYDLREFFNQWGIRTTEKYYTDRLTADIAASMAKGEMFSLPQSITDIMAVTGHNKPSWIPIQMKGITSSQPESTPGTIDELASKNKYCDYSTSSGLFEDKRDGKAYRYKRYGNYDWFTENLNYEDNEINIPQNASIPNPYSLSVTAPDDENGLVYGRLYLSYVTNAVSSRWCPEGWTMAKKSDWENLYTTIKTEYKLADDQLASAMISGGDKDYVEDGLWAKGALGSNATDEQRAAVGFNILPAGVFSATVPGYESGDEKGTKASFTEGGWFHHVFISQSSDKEYKNRNSRHYGSIRCIRPTQTSGIENKEKGTGNVELFPRIVNAGQPITITMKEGQLQKAVIRIYSSSGQKVEEINHPKTTNQITVQQPGTYIAVIEIGTYTTQVKFMVR